MSGLIGTRTILIAGVLISIAIAGVLAWPGSDGPRDASDDRTPVDLVAGREIYALQCASCHGTDLEGEPDWRSPGPDGVYPAPPHDETGHTWHHEDAMLFTYTKMGGEAAMAAQGLGAPNSGMPAFADVLTDVQIRDVLAYIASTWPERLRAMRAARAAGQAG